MPVKTSSILAALALWMLTGQTAHAEQAGAASELAKKAYAVLEKHCYRCHGQNGSRRGNLDYIFDVVKLIEKEHLKPKDSRDSGLFARVNAGEMPPKAEKIRPSALEIDILAKWIDAGAPAFESLDVGRPFITTKAMLAAVKSHLESKPQTQRRFLRYFTFTHLHNMQKVKDQDLRLYRGALSLLINSLSSRSVIRVPEAVDKEQTIFAIDLRDFGWQRDNLWQEILLHYPYGLTHEHYPRDLKTQELAKTVRIESETSLPMIRADWFIATASRPPLYHRLLDIPETVQELEKRLGVRFLDNFTDGSLKRAGFAKSGVSAQNRLVERHESDNGYYWKSYDFGPKNSKGDLFKFPLGPNFAGNEFANHAFVHDGGEMIYSLPNGLQAYMLVDAKDKRIDEGPVEVVTDPAQTSGSVKIVNGLSCMGCHFRGMVDFTDGIRSRANLAGAAFQQLELLYPQPKEMKALLEKDREKFLAAARTATEPFVRKDELAAETIGHIARWYLSQHLTSKEVAAELGIAAETLERILPSNPKLADIGLGRLLDDGSISREDWESCAQHFTSPFQEAARILKLGTPLRFDRQPASTVTAAMAGAASKFMSLPAIDAISISEFRDNDSLKNSLTKQLTRHRITVGDGKSFTLSIKKVVTDSAGLTRVFWSIKDRFDEIQFEAETSALPDIADRLTNKIGMSLTLIPAGAFTMGSPPDENGRKAGEDQTEVVIPKAFYLGTHEVTVGQFRQFVQETKHITTAEAGTGGLGIDPNLRYWLASERTGEYSWRNPGWRNVDDLPVVNVSWDDADQFCRWLSNRENATYQLPTEQEWEYSCRAGTVTPFSFGTGLNANRKLLANIADQSLEHYIPKEYHGSIKFSAEDDEHIFVAPVGAFAANGFGLHDMHGNVAEWCANAFGKGKAVRGGAWWHGDSDCRSARRDSRPPSSTTLSIGFRIVRRP